MNNPVLPRGHQGRDSCAGCSIRPVLEVAHDGGHQQGCMAEKNESSNSSQIQKSNSTIFQHTRF